MQKYEFVCICMLLYDFLNLYFPIPFFPLPYFGILSRDPRGMFEVMGTRHTYSKKGCCHSCCLQAIFKLKYAMECKRAGVERSKCTCKNSRLGFMKAH